MDYISIATDYNNVWSKILVLNLDENIGFSTFPKTEPHSGWRKIF